MKDLDFEEIDWMDIERGEIKEFKEKSFINAFRGVKSLKNYVNGQLQYSKNEDNTYNFVDPSHVCMTMNLDIDISLFDIEEGGVKEPPLNCDETMATAELIGVSKTGNLMFGSSKGTSQVSLAYISEAIRVFGIPDRVLCGEDYPLIMYFGKTKYLLAPRINSGDEYDKYYKFDFKQWCPQLYGIKPNDITKGQLLDMIYSAPLDTTVETLIKNMQSLRLSDGKTQNTEDFF